MSADRAEHYRDAFRPDVQGLRAVAVLLVVLDHAGVAQLAGGFVGVDVFFVISGFLITGWLLRRCTRTGRIPFADFYAARARRILPAASLTLVATAVASFYLLNYVRALSALHDCVWAVFFAANIHFAQIATDYFARLAPPSPVQQYWTLAVEEQFYVVWPMLLALALFVLRVWRRPTGARLDNWVLSRLAVIIALAVTVSLVYSIRDTSTNPDGAYFSALTRAWELGIGALLATTVPRISVVPGWLRAAMTWIGLSGILLAATQFTSQTPYPGSAALLPVLSTALVIAGGVAPPPRVGAHVLLGLLPFRVTGDVSYSFYLWHWPFLIIAADYEDRTLSLPTNLLLVTVAFGVSCATYRFFENPIHRSSRFSSRTTLALWPASIALVVVAAFVPTTLIQDRLKDEALAFHRPRVASLPYTVAVADSVTSARSKMSVPSDLSPPILGLAGSVYDLHGCAAFHSIHPVCHWGDVRATRTMVVVGDSHAQMWMSAFQYFAHTRGWRLIPVLKGGCEPLTIDTDECRSWYGWAMGEVRKLRPQLAVLSVEYSSVGDFSQATESGLRDELTALKQRSPRVVLVQDTPHLQKDPTDCLLANGATLGSCTFVLTGQSIFDGVKHIAESVRVGYLPTLQWFCAQMKCPTVIGYTIAFADEGHVTDAYAKELRKPFAAALSRLVNADSPSARVGT